MHPSAIVSLLILGCYLVIGGLQGVIEKRFNMKLEGTPQPRQLKLLFIILLLSLGTSFINPNTYKPLSLPFELASWDIARDEISELQRPTLEMAFREPYGLVLIVLGLSFLASWRRINIIHLVIASAFVYLSTGAIRFIPLMAIVSGPIIAKNFSAFFSEFFYGFFLKVASILPLPPPLWGRMKVGGIHLTSPPHPDLPPPGGKELMDSSYEETVFGANVARFSEAKAMALLYSFVAVAIVVGAVLQINSNPFYLFGFGIHKARIPVGAFNYVEHNGIRGNLFNTFHFGGYTSWRGFPERKPFIDGRGGLPKDLLEKALQATHLRNWRELERKYNIDYAILDYPLMSKSTFAKLLPTVDWALPHQDWALVFWDDGGLVYLKRVEKFRAIIERDEYKYVKPANDYTLLGDRFLDDSYGQGFIAELKRNIESQPENIHARLILGFVYNQRREYEKAIKVYEEVVRRAKFEKERAFSGIALAYSKLEDAEKAIQYYKAAEKEYTYDPQYYYNIAIQYQKIEKFDLALKYLEKAIDVNPLFLPAYHQIQVVAAESGKEEIGAKFLGKYQDVLRHAQGETHFTQAMKLTMDHKIHDAINTYKKSIEVNPHNPAAYNNLGYLYFDMGMLDEALKEQLEAIRVDPNWSEAHYGLALIYERQRAYEKAKEHWKRYLTIQPKGAWARKAKERLKRLEEM